MQELIVDITLLADEHSWEFCRHNEKNKSLDFKKNGTKCRVYYPNMSVVTLLEHPTQGKTQLVRNGISWQELEMIFENPRIHTGKGYVKKSPRKYHERKFVKRERKKYEHLRLEKAKSSYKRTNPHWAN